MLCICGGLIEIIYGGAALLAALSCWVCRLINKKCKNKGCNNVSND